MNDSNDFKNFCLKHKGAIIGGLIAVIIAFTPLRWLLVGLVIIAVGIWLGNYVQNNKEKVKDSIKKFVDKF